jgi:endonuclease/exonuclease/phosphatase family metal-dependent hydrolase
VRVLNMSMALVAGLLALSPVPATAQTTELRVLQWNIAGVTINPFDEDKPDNEGTLQVAERLVDIAAERRPNLVSLEETCAAQANFTKAQLAERFGSAAIHFADSAGTDVLCGYSEGTYFQSGTAIIAVGADSVGEQRTYYFTDDGLITSTKTERAAACMLVSFASTLGHEVQACALHLDKDDEHARSQAAAFVNFMTEDEDPLHPLVLAGDFNAPPDVFRSSTYAPEQGGQGEFVEVDHPANRPTFRDGLKIDYVFGHRDYFGTEVTAEVVKPGNCPAFPFIDHPCSDHSALFGTLHFATP